MHLQSDQRIVARVADATQSQFSGRQNQMAAMQSFAVIAFNVPGVAIRHNGPHRHASLDLRAALLRAAEERVVEPIARERQGAKRQLGSYAAR